MSRKQKPLTDAQKTYALMCAASNMAVSASLSVKQPRSKAAEKAYQQSVQAYETAKRR